MGCRSGAHAVLRRIRDTREQRYSLFRGVFRGAGDEDVDTAQPRLHSVLVVEGAAAAGKSLEDLDLDACLVDVTAVRGRGARALAPGPETVLQAGDVVVLRGTPDALAAAEMRIMQG